MSDAGLTEKSQQSSQDEPSEEEEEEDLSGLETPTPIRGEKQGFKGLEE